MRASSVSASRFFLRAFWVGVASVSLTAVIGATEASTASATRLCTTLSCEPADTYPANTQLAASLEEGTKFKILSTVGTIECENSMIGGETTAGTGKPLALKITELSFTGNCHLGGLSTCTSTIISLPTTPWLEATGEGDGIFSIEGAKSIEGNVRFKCGNFLSCYFTMPTATFQLKGGNPASFGATKVALEGLGLCPETSELDATYTLTEPAPAYLVG